MAWIAGLDESALLLHLVDLVLAVSLLELLWLLLRQPAAISHLAPNLLAGLSLTAALRLGLGGAGLAWVAPCLAVAGVAHGLDLRARRRWRISAASGSASVPIPIPTPTLRGTKAHL